MAKWAQFEPGLLSVVRSCGRADRGGGARFQFMISPAPFGHRGVVLSGTDYEYNDDAGSSLGRSMGSRHYENERDAKKAAETEMKRLCPKDR